MNNFEYEWPVKVYFGENTVKEKLESELKNWGRNIMLAYGGGSIKKNGIYDEIMEVLIPPTPKFRKGLNCTERKRST